MKINSLLSLRRLLSVTLLASAISVSTISAQDVYDDVDAPAGGMQFGIWGQAGGIFTIGSTEMDMPIIARNPLSISPAAVTVPPTASTRYEVSSKAIQKMTATREINYEGGFRVGAGLGGILNIDLGLGVRMNDKTTFSQSKKDTPVAVFGPNLAGVTQGTGTSAYTIYPSDASQTTSISYKANSQSYSIKNSGPAFLARLSIGGGVPLGEDVTLGGVVTGGFTYSKKMLEDYTVTLVSDESSSNKSTLTTTAKAETKDSLFGLYGEIKGAISFNASPEVVIKVSGGVRITPESKYDFNTVTFNTASEEALKADRATGVTTKDRFEIAGKADKPVKTADTDGFTQEINALSVPAVYEGIVGLDILFTL